MVLRLHRRGHDLNGGGGSGVIFRQTFIGVPLSMSVLVMEFKSLDTKIIKIFAQNLTYWKKYPVPIDNYIIFGRSLQTNLCWEVSIEVDIIFDSLSTL
jgi:hypothetical protein